MSKKLDELDVKKLLKKNPNAARAFAKNRKKLGSGRSRSQKEYGLGLPYSRPLSRASDLPRNEAKFKLEL
jgi:hypothetical protein